MAQQMPGGNPPVAAFPPPPYRAGGLRQQNYGIAPFPRDQLAAVNMGAAIQVEDALPSLLPDIVPRPIGWNGYTYYGVTTRRGLKQASKADWADKVVALWIQRGLLGVGRNMNPATEYDAMKCGWLVGNTCGDIVNTLGNPAGHADIAAQSNLAMAMAFKRFNYTANKYTKKVQLSSSCGMVPLMHGGNMATMIQALQAQFPTAPVFARDAQGFVTGRMIPNQGAAQQLPGATTVFNALAQAQVVAPGLVQIPVVDEALQYMANHILVHTVSNVAPLAAPNDQDFSFTEQLDLIQIDATTYKSYVGQFTVASLYYTNHQFINKLQFAMGRGYDTKGIKYGVSVINNQYDTLYILPMPNLETSIQRRRIYALPRGSRINLLANDADWNDTCLLVGVISTVGETGNQPIMQTGVNQVQAVPLELAFSAVQQIINVQDIRPLNEAEKLRKPDMTKYMMTRKKAAIGSINAQDCSWVIGVAGQVDMIGAGALNLASTGGDPLHRTIGLNQGGLLQRLAGPQGRGQRANDIANAVKSMFAPNSTVANRNAITAQLRRNVTSVAELASGFDQLRPLLTDQEFDTLYQIAGGGPGGMARDAQGRILRPQNPLGL